MPDLRFAAALVAPLLSLALSHDQVPSRLSSAFITTLRQEAPGMTAACWRLLHRYGEDAFPRKVDQCFTMMPAQRWRGIWEDYHEGQQFCAAGTYCSDDFDRPLVWITFADGVRPTRSPTERSYVVELIGRRTLRPGLHGHFGVFKHEIVVDRLISITPAPAGSRSISATVAPHRATTRD